MTPEDRRPTRVHAVAPLAECPLDPLPLYRERASTRGPITHSARIETYSPSIEGWSPRRPSPVLTYPLAFEERESVRADGEVRFEWDHSTLRIQVHWPAGTHAYGLGASPGPLLRNGRSLLCWNTDAWCYGEHTPALYQSHPWLLAQLPGGGSLGLLVDTPRRLLASVARDGVEFAVDGEPCVLHRVEAESPGEVLAALAAMIGPIERPPHWALGYHQCRWSYASADEVRAVATRMRAERIPCDAIWLDIDHMDRFRVFTWEPERFPDPPGLIDALAEQGFHTVAIVDPGIAVDEESDTYRAGREGRHFVEDSQGNAIHGRVWPGVCAFPDFTRASTRAWWASLVRRWIEESGLAGVWNDMNEPSVMRTPTGTLPESAQHRGMGGGEHARFHNLYGHLMCAATVAGIRAARPSARPFVLTRSAHLATSHLAATWTGDNMSRWEDLAWAVPMVLSLGLSGQPFSGPDLGGFFGEVDEELFVRWFELGAYLPFCRGHGEKHSPRKEPWSLGRTALGHVRAALERRMRLLPMLVTAFDQAHHRGLPPCRPLWFDDPDLWEVDDAFLLGDDLLVAPILAPGVSERSVPLPKNGAGWFRHGGEGEVWTGGQAHLEAPLGRTPVLARAGSIIVEAKARLHTGEADTLRTWHVYLDPRGRAEGELFEEPGEGLEEIYLRRRIQARLHGGRLAFHLEDRGEFPQPERERRLRLYGLEGGPREAVLPLGDSFELDLESSGGSWKSVFREIP